MQNLRVQRTHSACKTGNCIAEINEMAALKQMLNVRPKLKISCRNILVLSRWLKLKGREGKTSFNLAFY